MNTGHNGRGRKKHKRPIDIYALPIGHHQLIYAPLRQVIAMINTKALTALTGWLESGAIVNEIAPLIHRLDVKPCYPPEQTGSLAPVFLGIIPTRACNLSCVYCNFGARQSSGARLDLDRACDAVDWMAELAVKNNRNDLVVHFFGGEPFIAGDVIDAVVHRARAKAADLGLTPRFEAATNGVFDAARAQFVGDYFDTVVLSCDGFENFHDRQRPMSGGTGSFQQVKETAARLSRSTADVCLRICVTQENIHQLEPFTRWFAETFRPAIINIETLKPTPGANANGLTPPDPFEFATHCLSAFRTIRNMGIEAIYAAADISTVQHTFCPVGRDAAIVSPDGRISSCYLPENDWKVRGLDMNIGRQDRQGKMVVESKAVKRLRNLVTDKYRCRHCFCRWTCAGGCHVSETYPGCGPAYTDFCIQTRIVTACLLLEELGIPEKVDALLADDAALHKLAFNQKDTLGA